MKTWFKGRRCIEGERKATNYKETAAALSYDDQTHSMFEEKWLSAYPPIKYTACADDVVA